MSEDFCGGELGTRTPAPLRGQQRAACAGDDSHLAGEIGVQYILFHNILLLQLYSLARV